MKTKGDAITLELNDIQLHFRVLATTDGWGFTNRVEAVGRGVRPPR